MMVTKKKKGRIMSFFFLNKGRIMSCKVIWELTRDNQIDI